MHNNGLRLGLDIGTNSIGWCLLELRDGQPSGIRDMGVRIFSDSRDPKSKSSLATGRRMARLMRRRRDRFLARRKSLLYFLKTKGLLPENPAERDAIFAQNPYQLRAKALDEMLSPAELGRVLFHLNQRRGFKSNRREETAKKEETDFQKEMAGLEKKLADSNCRTLGEFLWKRFENKEPVRARAGQELYPTRKMYLEEFEKIVEKQAPFHPTLTTKDWEHVWHIIFYQRPLKAQEAGPCQINYEHKPGRTPRALPSYQKFLIAQELANLIVTLPDKQKRPLTKDEKKELWEILNSGKHKTGGFKSVRKWIGLPEGTTFNLESETREKLAANETAYVMTDEKYFGEGWHKFSDEQQNKIVDFFWNEENELKIAERATHEWGLSSEQATHFSRIPLKDLPKGYGRFCADCAGKLAKLMMEEGTFYKQAYDKLVGDEDQPDLKDRLEYYGKCLPEAVWVKPRKGVKCMEEERAGKIGNPTVHVALNQLRKVINCLLDRYGHPSEMVIELARDIKMSYEQKKRLEKNNNENKKRRGSAREKLQEQGVDPNDDNIKKYLLWEELNQKDCNDRKCPYSGRQISFSLLFSHEINIEHILPFSRTLDDSLANKTIAFRNTNNDKGNRSPSEAFLSNPAYNYAEILAKADDLPSNKKWRFTENAMERFEGENDFLARHLNDTAYLSKIARKYLQSVCTKVDTTPGRLTAWLRRHWGLNSILNKENVKTRDDHRHHAVDAFVVAMTDRKILNNASKSQDKNDNRFHVAEPWLEFRNEVTKKISSITVSHRPKHYPTGRFFKETAYGIVDPQKNEGYNLVTSKPIDQFKKNQVKSVRDKKLRFLMLEKIKGLEDEKAVTKALAEFGNEHKIRKVRFLEENKSARSVHHPKRNPKHEKKMAPDEVLCIRFWKMPDGSIEAKPTYLIDAYQKIKSRPHPNAKLMYAIFKGDTIRLIHKGAEKTVQVKILSVAGRQILFAQHNDSTEKKDNTSFSEALIKKTKFRKIHVDPLGKVKDAGFIYD
ncbi:MAG: type II CRISPR RNA-guided endonuclease Cas9 [Deltaproteobacteria bacterium]|nr:type II CRISPR RNA-guided endonuclease Cas9 [Deltaproteobacteria bacterium]